jgi:hypothetical protein
MTKKNTPRQKRIRAKTLKRHQFSPHFSHLNQHGIPTVQGVHHWYKHLFEHLGWMILAKERGYHDKLFAYKNSIKRLIEAIDYRLPNLGDKDTKKDFEIMKADLLVLKEHVSKDEL